MENPSDGEQQDTKRREVIKEKVGKVRHVGLPEKRIHREDELFDPADINIKEVNAAIYFASLSANVHFSQDIVSMIIQYLHDNEFVASFLTLQDEANVKVVEQLQQRAHIKAMSVAILGNGALSAKCKAGSKSS